MRAHLSPFTGRVIYQVEAPTSLLLLSTLNLFFGLLFCSFFKKKFCSSRFGLVGSYFFSVCLCLSVVTLCLVYDVVWEFFQFSNYWREMTRLLVSPSQQVFKVIITASGISQHYASFNCWSDFSHNNIANLFQITGNVWNHSHHVVFLILKSTYKTVLSS